MLKKNLQQDLLPVAVSFLYGKGDLKADFNGALDSSGTYGDKSDLVLKLTPKKPSAQYKFLYLVVDPQMYRVKQSIIIDSSNNSNHITFYEPNFETPVEAKWFEFNPKSLANFKIVDTDKEQASDAVAPATAPVTAPATAPTTAPVKAPATK